MGAPKIKFYQLPSGYKAESDIDVQQTIGDELLPCTAKVLNYRDGAVILSGIQPAEGTRMHPFDLTAGRSVTPYPLSLNNTTTQWEPQGISMSQVLVGPTGYLELRVLDQENNVILPTGYVIERDGDGIPTGITFNDGTNPLGPKISCWQRPANLSTNTYWALGHDDAYDGDNETFNRVVVTTPAGTSAYECPVGASGAYVVLPTGVTEATATFWFRSIKTKYFCGEHSNWIPGQDSKPRENSGGVYLGYNDMGPDVFVGMTDYAGDGTVVPDDQPNAGAYIDPGMVPKFIEPGSYSVTYRDGLVRFPSEVDVTQVSEGELTQVRANYAHLVGLRNVTQQVLSPVPGSSGRVFRAIDETVYPESHGKRWVGRNDEVFPLKVYVTPPGGIPEETPKAKSFSPYKFLTPKTSA